MDDNKYNIDLLEEILFENGYENILIARTGSEALHIINEKEPDLVLLDIMMPDMDGYEVCSILQHGKETSDIPVIMVTAKTTSEDLKQGFNVGAFDYIKKPFDEVELITRVHSALKLKQSTDEIKAKNIELLSLARQNQETIEILDQNISERKRLEDKLKRYTEHLEEEVKRQADELIQTEKMSAIGQLVAGVAHEINNPLSYLKTNSKFLKEDLINLKEGCQRNDIDLEIFIEIEEIIDTNIGGINRIATITKALKRFARPDTEGKAFANINDGIKDTLVMVHNNLKHRIKVNENYGDIPLIRCNIGQLNQVFMNIIMNASQAIDTGEIWIRTWGDDQDIYVEIKDNGEGIPEDIMGKIFDPFFTTKESGTGLGLSISYRITKDHDGCIVAKSIVEKGTTMTVVLPIGEQK